MRLIHGESETGWWELTSREPAPGLRSVVRRYTGYREHSLIPLRRREIPNGEVHLILSFGPRIQVLDLHELGSFVATVGDSWSDTSYLGEQYGLQVSFTPLGAFRLLGVPMDELGGVAVELSDLLGRPGARLIEQLADLPDWSSRFALLDTVLPVWLDEGREPSPLATYAWQQLTATQGRASISSLVDELGCSRRHLLNQFRAHIGVAPKSYARVLRCHNAMRLLRVGDWSIARIAQECGYFDQSHLNRDFKLITGVAPARFPFFQSDLPDAS
jgi:AraC-like DNA-binding protein